MRFESRELNLYAEPIKASQLERGAVYFLVSFVDEKLHIPVVETLVFGGIEEHAVQAPKFVFHSVSSNLGGEPTSSDARKKFAESAILKCEERELAGIYDFEHALDVLLRCSLRRRNLA